MASKTGKPTQTSKPKAKPKPKLANDWMSDAVHPSREGDFTRKAQEHHMSVQEFANWCLREGSDVDKLTKQQAVYARNASKISKANAKE